MKKIFLILCLILGSSIAANAQFEKGKWIINSNLTGLNFGYDTHTERLNLGLETSGGMFVADNLGFIVNLGASFNNNIESGDTTYDHYKMGLGSRYYFSSNGIYVGGGIEINKYSGNNYDRTLCGVNVESGYAYFLSRNITIEPSVCWTMDKSRSRFFFRLGFGIYL